MICRFLKSLAPMFSAVALFMCATAHATKYYVKSGATGNGSAWTNAFGNPQDALAAANVTEIWVALGTYKPTVGWDGGDNRTKTFELVPGVKMYGGFLGLSSETNINQRDPAANPTILSGDLGANDTPGGGNRSDNSYHVIVAKSAACDDYLCAHPFIIQKSTQVDGFTISGGNADYSSGNHIFGGSEQYGGGICIGYAGPAIQNCIITDNDTSFGGAGAHTDGSAAGVPGIESVDTPAFVTCTFSGNRSGTEAGGLCNKYSDVIATNCVFINNSATNGGGVYNNHTGELGSATVDLYNCTFYGNSATTGGGIYNNKTLIATNCILWGNTATSNAEIYNGSSATVTYSDVQGGFTGTGNINSDPQFVAAGSGNLRIDSDSPCRNVGYNTAVPADAFDVDDDTNTGELTPDRDRLVRVLNTTVDMGAYENHASTTCCADITGNCVVDVDDLLAVINGWGPCPVGSCNADIAPECAGNGVVNVDDLLAVINGFTGTGGHCGGCSEYGVAMPQSVQNCWDDCAGKHPDDIDGFCACYGACVQALCEAHIIDCDD